MIELFTSAFVTFLVIIEPIGCVPIFGGLVKGGSTAHARAMAVRSVLVAGAILFFFAFVGRPFLELMGIGLDAFRIAGGILLFLIAAEMVFEKRQERREERAEGVREDAAAKQRNIAEEDISVFPMAIPMIAGPGSIASVMLQYAHADTWPERGAVLGALLAVLLLTMGALLAAAPIMRVLGTKIEAMITRLLGVILAALAAQFVIDGLRHAFH